MLHGTSVVGTNQVVPLSAANELLFAQFYATVDMLIIKNDSASSC